ncbi:hypothetical protein YC2023_122804 [Brassica napus]
MSGRCACPVTNGITKPIRSPLRTMLLLQQLLLVACYLNSLPKPSRTLVASWDLGDDVLYTSTSAMPSRYQIPLP